MKGHINIHRNGYREHYKNIHSTSDFFKGAEYISLILQKDKLLIHKHYLDAPKKATKVTPGKEGNVCFGATIELPVGRYHFDESETTEDIAVIYLDEA